MFSLKKVFVTIGAGGLLLCGLTPIFLTTSCAKKDSITIDKSLSIVLQNPNVTKQLNDLQNRGIITKDDGSEWISTTTDYSVSFIGVIDNNPDMNPPALTWSLKNTDDTSFCYFTNGILNIAAWDTQTTTTYTNTIVADEGNGKGQEFDFTIHIGDYAPIGFQLDFNNNPLFTKVDATGDASPDCEFNVNATVTNPGVTISVDANLTDAIFYGNDFHYELVTDTPDTAWDVNVFNANNGEICYLHFMFENSTSWNWYNEGDSSYWLSLLPTTSSSLKMLLDTSYMNTYKTAGNTIPDTMRLGISINRQLNNQSWKQEKYALNFIFNPTI